MVDYLQRAREDAAKARDELVRVKTSYEEEVKELKRRIQGRDKDFEAMRTLWDRDRDDLRRLKDESLKLQKQNEDLVQENEVLKEELMVQEKFEEDLARSLAHLHRQLKSQCEEFEHHFSDLLWEPAQPQELRHLGKLAGYNGKLHKAMEDMEHMSPQTQIIELVSMFAQHRAWEFDTIKELLQNSSQSGQAKPVQRDNSASTTALNEPLMRTGAAIRLRFWQQSKDDHPWTLCENIYQARCQSLIEAGNIVAHQPDVASDIELFTHGFLIGEGDLRVFANMYGKDLEFCTRLIRRTPQFCTLLNAEAAVYLLPNWREERDDDRWIEWIRSCAKLWRDWEGLSLAVICGDEPITRQLPDLEIELQSVREFALDLAARSRYFDN